MKEITIDVWAIVSELIERVPGLLINRETFLRDVFRDKLSPDQLNRVVELGDYGDVSLDMLDSAANSCINKTRLTTSGASFVAGLPSSLPTLPATVTADITQSFAFYVRIAQQLSYIYGEANDFTKMQDDDRMTKLLLYIGAMFGIEAASQVLALMSYNAGRILAKKFGQVAVTKVLNGVPWKVARTIAKILGVKLTKGVVQKGISKVVPVLGGIVSGALTYATFGPMAKKLQCALRDTLKASEAEIEELYEVISSEDDMDIAISVCSDVIESEVLDPAEFKEDGSKEKS